MITIIPVLVVIILLSLVVLILIMASQKEETRTKEPKKHKKNRSKEAVIRDATRRLSQNPKDPEALLALGDIYYQDQVWDKALKIYETLVELCATNPDLDEYEINCRYGMSALKLGLQDQAYKGLVIARSLQQNNFEVNYNLGYLEFLRKNYEKAVQLLQQARTQDPEHAPTLRYLGHALFKLHRYREALVFLRKAVDLIPEDKESLYTMGECYYELGQVEQAIKIFTHLRPDPTLGPTASLFAGTIHMNQHQYPKAIMDFEIGLKHENIKIEIQAELKYRLALAYLKQQEIGRALTILKELQNSYQNYKDVPTLIAKYQELNSNKNLQIYLMAPTGDFVTLCRKVVLSFFPKARVKITNIAVNKNEWADILAEVDTPKWADVVMFRFIRNQGVVGELTVRDFHAHLKEVKAGKGYCLSAGTFSDEAKKFVEARLIDLYEKNQLSKILESVDASVSAIPL
ncbi:MAG TPA: tetratricopeptide repeat protein [Termitinemataceae bacterium]|nr:tetratricopeptide repeat protein [Termitinemataceae bacterium]HOM23048.1 tetratricopeptide repeat protein [Termitinemataceae bacterium]HPQ00584.1 tetratricopeptide repeat protein [Termitinemataceae bacterium]